MMPVRAFSGPSQAAAVQRETRQQMNVAEWVTLGLYGAVVTTAIHFHEPWADEAQAWQIARSLSLGRMFQTLRYEGSPGLWHLLLWFLSRLHVSYAGMRWASGLVALGGIAILLRYSPFPRWLKLLLPFTYFLLFQYAVIARSYVLVPLLLFALATLWAKRFQHPVAVAVTLGLLANVALHAAMLSAGFAAIYALEWYWQKSDERLLPVRRLGGPALLLCTLYAISILTARPAKDITFPQGQSPLPPAQARASEQLAQLRHGHSVQAIEYQFKQRLTPPLASGLVLPLPLALLFWVVLAGALAGAGKLRYLIPGVLLALFCHFVAARPWHTGLMTPYLITILWMVWPNQERGFHDRNRYEQGVLAFLSLIVLIQIYWAVHALNFDRRHSYSPAKMTAVFLKPYLDQDAKILETGNHFDSVAVEPYFNRKVFANQPYPFHWWSTRNLAEQNYSSLVQQRPALVLVQWLADGDTQPTDEAIDLIPEVRGLKKLGYRNTQIFCGKMPVQGAAILETHCALIFEPLPDLQRQR